MRANKTLTELDIQASAAVTVALAERLAQFLVLLPSCLDAQVDIQLGCAFLTTIWVIVQFRHRSYGLLSELGAYILSPDKAPAEAKRLSNLLRCKKLMPSNGKAESRDLDPALPSPIGPEPTMASPLLTTPLFHSGQLGMVRVAVSGIAAWQFTTGPKAKPPCD